MPQPRTMTCARILCAFSAAIFLSGHCSHRAQARAGIYITGTVLDSATHEPVAGAVVSLYAPAGAAGGADNAADLLSTSQSLQNGSYILNAPSTGQFTLKLDAPDATSSQQSVSVPAAGLNLNLLLSRPRMLRVKLERQDGKPLLDATATVTLWTLDADDGAVTTMECPLQTGGQFSVILTAALKPAEILLIQVRSARDGFGRIRAVGPPIAPLVVTLKPGLTLQGKVVDAAGMPRPGKSVWLYHLLPDGWPAPDAKPLFRPTDPQGGFSFPNLAPGGYLLQSELKGNRTRAHRVELPAQTPVVLSPADPEFFWNDRGRPTGGFISLVNIVEVLDPERTKTLIKVSGSVIDRATKRTLPGAVMVLVPSPAPGAEEYDRLKCSDAHANPDSSFTLHATSSGHYLLKADVPGYREGSRSVDVPPQGLAGQVFSLSHLLTAKVKVLAPNGSPVKAGVLHLYSTEIHPRQNLFMEGEGDPSIGPDGMVEISSAPYGGEDNTPENATGFIFAARLETMGYGAVRLPAWPREPVVIRLKPAITLSGKILDRHGQPEAGTEIWADARTSSKDPHWPWDLNVRSDARGGFKFPELPAGDYDIATRARYVFTPDVGYESHFIHLTAKSHTVVLRATDPQSYGLIYGPGTVWISGEVQDRLSGKPLDGATVTLLTRAASGAMLAESASTVTTGNDGTFHVPTAKAGPHRVEISDGGYIPMGVNLPVQQQAIGGLVIAAAPLPALRLKLLNRTGQPLTVQTRKGVLANSSLNAIAVLAWKGGSLSTGADAGDLNAGILSMNLPERMPHAPLTSLVVAVRDERGGCAELRLKRWPDHPLTVRLQTGSALIGIVKDAKGKPVDAPYLRVVRLLGVSGDQNWQSFAVIGNADGTFAAPHLLPGVYELRVHIPGQDLRYHRITVAGAQTRVTLTPADSKSASSGFPD